MPVGPEEIESTKRHFATARAGGRCEECGFDWSASLQEAAGIITGSPRWCKDAIGDRLEDAVRPPGPGVWSPSAYVWHMADAIGVWAERLVALAHDPHHPITGFDQDDLADVRSYEKLSPVAALWALQRRVDDWNEALSGVTMDLRFEHPDFGPWNVAGVVRWMAHELYHHQHDIQRALSS